MHRAVMQACLPWFIWLCVASLLALVLVQCCGVRLNWRRLTRLRRCEEGAVQSLSLVLTLPVFVLLMLFIVQVSQIMLGTMMVHYAAFASARAASVWIPADVTPDKTFRDPPFEGDGMIEAIDEALNWTDHAHWRSLSRDREPNQLEPANVLFGDIDGSALPQGGTATMNLSNGQYSFKYRKIVLAAVLPCLTISPSRRIGQREALIPELQKTYHSLIKLYPKAALDRKSASAMFTRLKNKLNYAGDFTTVELIWQNVPHPVPDIVDGPTYNPFEHPDPEVPRWNPNEVGFRDPVTVNVTHQFALLPGIGRVLALMLTDPNASQPTNSQGPSQTSTSTGYTDRVAPRITRRTVGSDELYTIRLQASATFVNEGFKSVIRYAVQP